MYIKPQVRVQYVVYIHRTTGTEWVSRHDTHQEALDSALDWATTYGMEEDFNDAFLTIESVQVVTLDPVGEPLKGLASDGEVL